MADAQFFDHEDPEIDSLRTPTDRARAVGIDNPKIAENIITDMAMLYESGEPVYPIDAQAGLFSRSPGGPALPRHTYRSLAESMLKRWLDSAGHRANILSVSAIQLGVGSAFTRTNGFPTFIVAQEFQHVQPVQVRPSSKPLSQHR